MQIKGGDLSVMVLNKSFQQFTNANKKASPAKP